MSRAAAPLARVLGTRVYRDPLPARDVTWLVADLHVTHRPGEEVLCAHLDRVLKVAREDPSRNRVFIMGDLLEFYVDARQLQQPDALPGWAILRRALVETTQAGVPVAALWGNRDFLLDPAFERATGCRVVKGGVRLDLAGQPTLLIHGDELCLNDVPYQKSKRWMRNRLVQTLWRVLPIPLRWRLKVGGSFRKESVRSTAEGDAFRFDPAQQGLDRVFSTDARQLVFGHIHRASRGPWLGPDGVVRGQYAVLPALDVKLAAGGDPLGGYCIRAQEPDAHGAGGLLQFWDPATGAVVADPGPARWARATAAR